MGQNIRAEKREGYLYFYVEGQDTLASCLASWRAILETSTKEGIRNILIEENMEGQLSALEMFELCKEVANMCRGMGLRVAFVDDKEEDKATNIFGQVMLRGMGFHPRIFDSVKKAEKWLKGRI